MFVDIMIIIVFILCVGLFFIDIYQYLEVRYCKKVIFKFSLGATGHRSFSGGGGICLPGEGAKFSRKTRGASLCRGRGQKILGDTTEPPANYVFVLLSSLE